MKYNKLGKIDNYTHSRVYLRDYLQLSVPPSTTCILLAPFDALQRPRSPHFPTQDTQSRDHITVDYYIQAIKYPFLS